MKMTLLDVSLHEYEIFYTTQTLPLVVDRDIAVLPCSLVSGDERFEGTLAIRYNTTVCYSPEDCKRHPEDGNDTFLRNVVSHLKTTWHLNPRHTRHLHMKVLMNFKSQIYVWFFTKCLF
jgi:hypothetical protein